MEMWIIIAISDAFSRHILWIQIRILKIPQSQAQLSQIRSKVETAQKSQTFCLKNRANNNPSNSPQPLSYLINW